MTTDRATPSWTIRALLEWTEGHFRQKGIDSPRLDAQILLAHTLGCTRTDLYVRFDEPTEETARTAFKGLIRRRLEGCPVAYLVGYREFFGLSFEVSPAVLIPRPETEFLVVEALRLLQGLAVPRLLDLGSGSGNVAVSVAHRNRAAEVVATDASPDALDVAIRNAARHGVAARVRFHRGDLFAAVPPGERFDLVVSNPPYVDPREIQTLAREVRDYEPRTALDGGPEGLNFYRRLTAEAPSFLRPGGRLLVEIGATQEAAVRQLFDAARFTEVRVVADGAKLPRVVAGRCA